MKGNGPQSEQAAEMRRKAEIIAREASPPVSEPFDSLTPENSLKMLHELEVRQIELEMQNEELRRVYLDLEAARERYFDLYDLAPVGYVTVSEQGQILESNLAAATLFGVVRGALLKKRFSGLIFNQDAEIFQSRAKRVFKTGEPLSCELRMLKNDGTVFWVQLQAAVGQDEAGVPSLRVVLSDITERRQTDEGLRESENLLRESQSIAGLGSYVLDLSTQSWTSSEVLDQLFGIDETFEHTENGWISLIHPEDRTMMDDYFRNEVVGQGRSFDKEYRIIRHHDQAERWVAGLGKLEVDVQGRPVKMSGTIQDITERKQMDEVQVFLAQTSSWTADEPFFNALARYLARSLDMDFVCIDRLDGDGLTAHTLAVWSDGQFEDNVSYALKDTPCGDVVGKMVCCFPANVCQFFPRDQVLQDMCAESYVGVTLFSHSGKPIGLIAVIGNKPLANRTHAEATLKLVAVRAAGELERLDAEAALLSSNERFHRLLQEIPSVAIQGYAGDGTVQYWNKGSELIYGYTAEEALGRNLVDLIVPPDMRDSLADGVTQMVETGNAIPPGELSLVRKDGSLVSVFSSHAVVNVTGSSPELFCVDVDLTARKRTEEKLKESEHWRQLNATSL